MAGNTTKKKSPTADSHRVKSLDALKSAATKEHPVRFTLGGERMKIIVRPLNDVEMEAVDAHDDVRPPLLPGRDGSGPMDYDFSDPTFLKEKGRVDRLRQADMIDRACVDLELPGETIAEKSAALREALTPAVIDLLVSEIERISNRRIEALANFSTSDGSEASRG